MRINSIVVGSVQGKLRAASHDLAYDVNGNLFGGQIECRGDWQPPVAGADGTNKGVLQISGIEFQRIGSAFPRNPVLADLAGRIDFRLPFEQRDKFGWPLGRGQLELSHVGWRHLTWAKQLIGVVSLNAGRLQLIDFSGDLAGGQLRAAATLDLNQRGGSKFTLAIDDIRAEDLLAPWPAFNKMLSGPASAHFRGSLSRPWRVSGTLEMDRGQIAALPVSDVRLPLMITFEPRTLACNVDLPDGAGQVGRGRVQIRAAVRSSHTISVDSQISFVDADLQPLLAQAGAAGELSGSRATGTIKLSGQNVRSFADLSGNIEVKLRDLHSGGFAPFQRITPYLSGGLASGSFNDGSLRGRIGGGTLQIDRLVVGNATTQVFASGRVMLSGGLDLDVLISNNQLPGGPLASAGLARIPLAASGPIGWIVLADELLANRSIYLDVSGTMASPVINVRPLPTVTDEAARFFLGGQL